MPKLRNVKIGHAITNDPCAIPHEWKMGQFIALKIPARGNMRRNPMTAEANQIRFIDSSMPSAKLTIRSKTDFYELDLLRQFNSGSAT